jgi:hypothetical protein
VIGGTEEDAVNALMPQTTDALQAKQVNSRKKILAGGAS